MEEDHTNKLTKACRQAFIDYPKSCSHSVWYVIKQYKPEQRWMSANDLVDHLNRSSDWKEVPVNVLSELASDGVLVVGGAKENGHGHVIVVYPGENKQSGGFHYEKNGTDKIARSHGDYALAMSTASGRWPGAKSIGDKTVFDAWGAAKFNSVRFWKYVGPKNEGTSLLSPQIPTKIPAGAKTGQKPKHLIKRFRVKTKQTKKDRWSFKTITDCFGRITNHKWQKVFK